LNSRKYPSRPWVSAHAIIFNQKNEILLTKRAAPPRRFFWSLPGGAIDLGETVEEGVTREIFEETSVQIKNLRFVDYVNAIHRDNNGKVLYHYVVLIYAADYLEGVVKADDDALDAKWFSSDDIIARDIQITEELVSIIKRMVR
jgi:ADP-ribose pyrophosphatase